MTYFVIPTDPDILAQVVVDKAGLPDTFEEPAEPKDDNPIDWHAEYERLKPLMNRIPACEADTFELFYFRRKLQKDIGEILGITQAAVSYRLNTTRERLKFLLSWPGIHLTEREVIKTLTPHAKKFGGLPGHLNGLLTIKIMGSMLRTSSQTQTGHEIGMSQSSVAHRFHRGVRVLSHWEAIYDEFTIIYESLKAIEDHPNILSDVGGKSHRARSNDYAKRKNQITKAQLGNIEAMRELDRLTR